MAHNAHLNLGLLYLQQKEYDRSMARYHKAIAIHPYYVEARMHFREIPRAGYRLPGQIGEFMKSTNP